MRKIILKSSKMEEFRSDLWFTINLNALALIQNGNQRSKAGIFVIKAKSLQKKLEENVSTGCVNHVSKNQWKRRPL